MAQDTATKNRTSSTAATMDGPSPATEAFAERVMGDLAATLTSIQCALGDYLGLFRILAATGPATSIELATAAGVDERCTREWASGLTAAGYLEHDATTRTFSLPAAHVPVLAEDGTPNSLGGFYQELYATGPLLPRLAQAFRDGGGIHISEFPDTMLAGTERITGAWIDGLLVQVWLPMVPDVVQSLQSGIRVADVGCGSGRTLVRLAQAYPKSTFVGYDYDPASLERARAHAATAGVADRLTFVERDINDGLEGTFDLITAFDVIHDMGRPRDALETVRRHLAKDGTFLLLEMNSQGGPNENQGPIGTIMYGASMTYCLHVSLAEDGEGLGTAGMPEPVVREFATEAGFQAVERLPIDDPFSALYALRI